MRRSTFRRITGVNASAAGAVWYLHDISTHQSVAEELIECTSLHRDRGEADGRRSLIISPSLARSCPATQPATSPIVRPGPGPVCVCVLAAAGGGRAMAGILAWFWNERFWLPHNVTWADLKNTDEATFPQAEDLYLACPLAFCIFMIRLVFERWVPAVRSPAWTASRSLGPPHPPPCLRVEGWDAATPHPSSASV